MNRVRRTMSQGVLYGVSWYCPGCKDRHHVPVSTAQGWGFNNNFEKPTLQPSVLVYPADRLDAAGQKVRTPRCHIFMHEGRIQFLSDCEHALAGQDVEMQPEEEADEIAG